MIIFSYDWNHRKVPSYFGKFVCQKNEGFDFKILTEK